MSESVSFEHAINTVANHEAKAIAYMALDDVGPITHPGLSSHIHERFQPDAPITGSLGSFAITFEGFNFASCVEAPSRFNARVVKHFEAKHQTKAIPAIGAMLDWSLKYDLGLNEVLGNTPSTTDKSRAPINSLAIIGGVLEGTRVPEIKGHNYSSQRHGAYNSKLKQLMDANLIQPDLDVNRFKIDDPVYKPYKIPFEGLKPERQHVYRVLQVAKEIAPEREWNIEEILGLSNAMLVQELRENVPFTRNVRRMIVHAVSTGSPRDFLGAVHKIELVHGKYKVNDDHHDALADIVERAVKLRQNDVSFINSSRDRAHDIYSTPEVGKKLIEKAVKKSSYRKMHTTTKS